MLLAILSVGLVAGTAVWRGQHSRAVTIVVDPEFEKTLQALGSDLDLRDLRIHALNERLRGVQQIIAFQGAAGPLDATQRDAASFKPFRLDLPAGDFAHWIRDMLGTPPPEAVRVELMCAPLPCTASGATQGTLLVTLSGPEAVCGRLHPPHTPPRCVNALGGGVSARVSRREEDDPRTKPAAMLALSRSIPYNQGMEKRRPKLSDQVRQAVDASGLSRYRISKRLGIAESTMSRFMAGGGLSMEYLDALAELLGLNIVAGKRPNKKGVSLVIG